MVSNNRCIGVGMALLVNMIVGCSAPSQEKPIMKQVNRSESNESSLIPKIQQHIVAGDKAGAIGAYHWLEKNTTGTEIARSVTLYFPAINSPQTYNLCPIEKPLPTDVSALVLPDGSTKTKLELGKPDCSASLFIAYRSQVTTSYNVEFRILRSVVLFPLPPSLVEEPFSNLYKFNTRLLGFSGNMIHNSFDERAFFDDVSIKQAHYIEWL